MKHLKKFETLAGFQSVQATLDRPNVSLIEANMGVKYLPIEKRVICKYNVTSTSSATTLRTNYEQNIFKSMEIDGVMLNELVTEYTFDMTGIHTVKYELYDETKLGNQAPVFYNSNLVECIIPNSVTSIGQYTFTFCTGLTSINIPNSVTSIGHDAFSGSSGLTSIDIPNSVTSIGATAFQGCIGLTSINIPNGVKSIGYQTFSGCNITSCTIGSGVTSIGEQAFDHCTSLTNIICNAMTAPTIDSTTFQHVKTDGTLTVPSGSTGYDVWMGTGDYYLGKYNWTKVEQ